MSERKFCLCVDVQGIFMLSFIFEFNVLETFKFFITVIFQIYSDRYFSNSFYSLFFKFILTVIFQIY